MEKTEDEARPLKGLTGKLFVFVNPFPFNKEKYYEKEMGGEKQYEAWSI